MWVQWIPWWIMPRILSSLCGSTTGKEELKLASRWRKTSVYACWTMWLISCVFHLHCSPPPEPNSGGTLNSSFSQADELCCTAIAVRSIKVGLVMSSSGQSFIASSHKRLNYVWWIVSAVVVKQIKPCTPKLIFMIMIKQDMNIGLTWWTFAGHVTLSLANSLATILESSVGNLIRNPSLGSIELLQRYTIAACEQITNARTWCTISAMKTIVKIIHLPLKCRHMEDLSFSGLNWFWRFPHTTNYESWWSSLHLWQRDLQTMNNWWL